MKMSIRFGQAGMLANIQSASFGIYHRFFILLAVIEFKLRCYRNQDFRLMLTLIEST
jgi:hypothetical protein